MTDDNEMTNPLTSDDAKRLLEYIEEPIRGETIPTLRRLCLDYVTLWDELQNERSISDRLLQRVAELEKEPQRLHDLSENELMSWWSKGSRG